MCKFEGRGAAESEAAVSEMANAAAEYRRKERFEQWTDDEVAAFAEREAALAREQEREDVLALFQLFLNDCRDGKWQPDKFVQAVCERGKG